ncbi:MAG: ATP-binding cassette domain-containing protein [Mycoplasmoidaceae bacterium]|nr:ATP-binding cassette domain-containing protein [Mycoplasmoidaceae bacterium]
MKILDKYIQKKFKKEDIQAYNEMKDKPILFVKNLTKIYSGKKVPAINNLSFNVYPGQFHAFIGANGAGKTTTIKSLIGAYFK